MKFWGLFFALIGLVWTSGFAVGASPPMADLKAGSLRYQDSSSRLHATQNVSIGFDGFELKTSDLWFDTAQNRAVGTADVSLSSPGFKGKGSGFSWELASSLLHVSRFRSQMVSTKNNEKVSFFFKEAVVSKNFIIGDEGWISACMNPTPHYRLTADQVRYEREKFIEGWNVWYQSTWWGFLPVVMWTPYYRYSVDRRSTIWNIPVIGKKETPGWGWFIQNTIDYDSVDGRDSSVFLDWYEFKGLGLGIRHQMKSGDHSGSVMYYFLKEQDTGRLNEKIVLGDSVTLGKDLLSVEFGRVNAERISASGRQTTEVKRLIFLQPEPEAKTEWTLSDYQDDTQQVHQFLIGVSRQKNTGNDYAVSLSQHDNQLLRQRDLNGNLSHTWDISQDDRLNSQFGFLSRDIFAQPSTSFLKTSLDYRHRVSPVFSYNIRVNTLSDFDLNPATSNLALKQYFYKVPELVLSYSDQWSWAVPTVSLTVARYQESFLTPAQFYRVYPSNQDFGLGPNTVIYTQSLSKTGGVAEAEGQWSWGTGYSQYLFFTPNTPIFKGDAMYSLSGTVGYEKKWGWIGAKTQYSSLIAPDNNTSPYFKFSDRMVPAQLLSETISFYFFKDLAVWQHSSGYDWVASRWQDYRSVLTVQPNPYWRTVVAGGKKLSLTALDESHDFLPLSLDSVWVYRRSKLAFSMGVDPNEWIYRSRTLIQQSSVVLGLPFGVEAEDSQWRFEVTYLYNTVNQPFNFDFNRYEMQVFELVKQDHCQTFSLGYNKLKEEVTFRYSLDAFPDDALELISNKNTVRFGGRLNAKSEERF